MMVREKEDGEKVTTGENIRAKVKWRDTETIRGIWLAPAACAHLVSVAEPFRCRRPCST